MGAVPRRSHGIPIAPIFGSRPAETDAELESAVNTVVDKMKADRMKERVTVYYLLAKHFNKLDVFAKPPVSTAKTSAPKADAGKRAGGHTKKSA